MTPQVLEFLLAVPKGKVVTYGQIAEAIGHPGAARAVGNALHKNPDISKYPCYKVVNSAGKLSCRYTFGGIAGQKRRLEQEGIIVNNNRIDLKKYLYNI